ncbi:MAG: hypothetical protein ABSE51_01005 [Terracidiphilus sp.]|jgi:hypothetical protein
MRVNLITQPSGPSKSSKGNIPLSLTIRPACGLPGDYQFPTDSEALMRLLRKETNLPATVLERFEHKLGAPIGARLLGVELGENVLTDIGYFID